MYVICLHNINGNISIHDKKLLKYDFGDPMDKIHLKRSEGLQIVPVSWNDSHVLGPPGLPSEQDAMQPSRTQLSAVCRWVL